MYKYINICEINWKERSKKLKSRRSTLDCSAVEEEEEEEEEEEGGGGGGGGGGSMELYEPFGSGGRHLNFSTPFM